MKTIASRGEPGRRQVLSIPASRELAPDASFADRAWIQFFAVGTFCFSSSNQFRHDVDLRRRRLLLLARLEHQEALAIGRHLIWWGLCREEMLYGLCFRADEPKIIVETCMDRASAKQGSSRRRQYPIKRHDSQESCFGGLPVPAAIWIRAGDLLVSKHFHCLDVRKRCRRALPLKVDVVAAFGAFEDDSVCFAHGS